MYFSAICVFVLSLVLGGESRIASKSRYVGLNFDLEKWAHAAFRFVQNMTCQDAVLTTEEDCHQLKAVAKSETNFYSADLTTEGKLMATLPDGPLSRMAAHDSVLLLDPYPRANLGHLLVVFFLDVGWSELQCGLNGGQYLGNNECLTLALRKRCHNLLTESKWKLKYLNNKNRNKQCEINFFPLVHLAGESPTQLSQRLKCRDDIEGFAPCPILRPKNHTDTKICDPLQMNTHMCSTTVETVNTRCRLLERCDHAVIISGGWDRLTDSPQYLHNILGMHEVLKNNGFPDGNIKIFYSNGDPGFNTDNYEIYPSAFKLTMRYHIRKLCQSLHCADSFFLYLNSPTKNDGSTLLWDMDENGEADENEIYTIKELLFDIQDCAAQQVYIIADQSYSGKLIHALEHSMRHYNVLAFASGQEHEYSWNADYTKQWLSFQNYKNSCISDIHQVLKERMMSSHPLTFDGSKGNIRTTLCGAPCNVRPPFTQHELQREYFGCQNLPSSIWLRRQRTYNREDDE